VIGILAPPECLSCFSEGSLLCENCVSQKVVPYGRHCWSCGTLSQDNRTCQKCRKTGSPSRVWVSTNYDGVAKDLLRAYKFSQQRPAAEALARIMSSTFHQYSQGAVNYLIVPVPTATGRVRERGFDHAALLARQVAKDLGLPVSRPLGRLGQSRQVGAKRPQRQIQMADKIWVKNRGAVAGQQILLIDDVVTTGATLKEASKVLRQVGATRVDALIFAKRL